MNYDSFSPAVSFISLLELEERSGESGQVGQRDRIFPVSCPFSLILSFFFNIEIIPSRASLEVQLVNNPPAKLETPRFYFWAGKKG